MKKKVTKKLTTYFNCFLSLYHNTIRKKYQSQKNLIIMNAQEFISNEMNIRIKLVEDVKFRELCVKVCKELGISAKAWNENKMDICLHIANQFIGLDIQGDGKLRAYLEK